MPSLDDMEMAQRAWEDDKAAALAVADLQGPTPKTKKLTPDEEVLLYNQMTKGWTPDKEIAMLQAGKSREEVGLAKFDQRDKLAKSNGRALDKYAQAKYHADMAKKIDPSWTPLATEAQEPAFPTGMDTEAPPAGLPLPLGG